MGRCRGGKQKSLASDHPHVSGVSVIELYLNTWDGLNKLGKTDVASVYLKQALAAYQLLPEAVNGYHETTLQLGYALLAEEQYDEIIPLVSQSIKSPLQTIRLSNCWRLH